MTDTIPRHDGFTPARQRTFLETLVADGTVRRACEAAGMSREAAYDLRNRAGGAAFALGWDAALLLARTRLADLLMERAIEGQEDVIVRDPDSGERRRHRHDNRLALSLLARLDRFADGAPGTVIDAAPAQPVPHADTRLIAQDWEAFLDLISDGHGGAGAALFLSARRPDATVGGMAVEPPGPCQLCRTTGPDADADADTEGKDDGRNPDEDFGEFTMRKSTELNRMVTDFPPPPQYDGVETGSFGDEDYQRTMTDGEVAVLKAALAAELKPVLEHGRRMRRTTLKELSRTASAAGIHVAAFRTRRPDVASFYG